MGKGGKPASRFDLDNGIDIRVGSYLEIANRKFQIGVSDCPVVTVNDDMTP